MTPISARHVDPTVLNQLDLLPVRRDFRSSGGSASRCGSPCSILDSEGELINVPVKNTFLNFRVEADELLDEPVRRSRSLEDLKRDVGDRDGEVWTCSPRLQLARIGSWPGPLSGEGVPREDTYTPESREQYITNDGKDMYVYQDCASGASDDVIAEIAAFHGAAKRLVREQKAKTAEGGHDGAKRVPSWPGSTMTLADCDSDEDSLEVAFDLTIEEGENPIKPVYTNPFSPRGRQGSEQPSFRRCGSNASSNDSRLYAGYSNVLGRVSSLPCMETEGAYDRYDRSPSSHSPKITQYAGVEYAHNRVPKKKNLRREFERARVPMTTIMIRNIPNRYRQQELVEEININDLDGTYDFVYLPMDKSTTSNVGYAFVNFTEEQHAVKAMQIFTSYRFSKYQNVSRKIASVSVAHIQGFEANLRHYKQSAVNDGKVTDNRPLVLAPIFGRVQLSP